MALTKIVPLAYLAACIAAAVALDWLWSEAKLIAAPWNLLGIIGVALGVALVAPSVWSLKRHGTTVKPLRKPKVLVTTGVFRISRNPIYLGFVLVLLGTVVLLGSLTPWLLAVAVAVFLHAVFVRFEETRLEEVFGEAWAAYKRKVRRWL
jgi:protein-S-isoprenylcysteine O-methyltransferase Ste14